MTPGASHIVTTQSQKPRCSYYPIVGMLYPALLQPLPFPLLHFGSCTLCAGSFDGCVAVHFIEGDCKAACGWKRHVIKEIGYMVPMYP